MPSTLNPNVTGWLQYDSKADLPTPAPLEEYNDFDDFNLVPYDRQAIYKDVTQTITLDMKMDNLGDGAN